MAVPENQYIVLPETTMEKNEEKDGLKFSGDGS